MNVCFLFSLAEAIERFKTKFEPAVTELNSPVRSKRGTDNDNDDDDRDDDQEEETKEEEEGRKPRPDEKVDLQVKKTN